MLVDKLQKRAAMSAALRKLAAYKPGMLSRAGAAMAAHPLTTATGVVGAGIVANEGRKTWHSMKPKAHATMLGMAQ